MYYNDVIVNVHIDGLPGDFSLTYFVRFTNYAAIISLCSVKQSAFLFETYCNVRVGRDSVGGMATHYGLDGPGIKSRWGRNFPHPPRATLDPTPPPIQLVLVLSRG